MLKRRDIGITDVSSIINIIKDSVMRNFHIKDREDNITNHTRRKSEVGIES